MARVRTMDEIGAGDIALGQLWRCEVTEPHRQRTSMVVAVEHDHAILRETPGSDDDRISFGSLLTQWVLVGEAA